MTSRANQNWPDEVTYDISTECGPEHAAVSTVSDDRNLDLPDGVGTVVESTERTVTALMTLVDEVMQ